MRLPGTIAILILVAASLAAATGAEPAAPAATAKITYVTGASVYVDAGRDRGVEAGMILEVVREGSVVARLRVTEVSSARAICAREPGGTEVAEGDAVRWTPAAVPGAAAAAPAVPAGGASSRGRGPGLHGRVGVRWLYVRETEGEGGFSQPALDLFLDGRRLGGSPVDLAVDVRSRRTYRRSVSEDPEDLTAVYRMSVAWQAAGSPWRATAGRQMSPSLAAVNIFDGLTVEAIGRRWRGGLFGGTQPDEADLGYSSEIRTYGGYVGLSGLSGGTRRWSVSSGAAGAYEGGEVSREFLFLQGSYTDARWSIWAGEEVDLNRDWKEDWEDSNLTFTSTYVNLRFRLGKDWTLSGGYDNRRNVRLYRDRVTPETEFDDAYRTGAWGGVTWRFLEKFSAGLDVRTSAGGSLGSTDGVSLLLTADRLTSWGLDMRGRSTRYEGDTAEGWFHSASVGFSPRDTWRVGVVGGVRDESDPLGTAPDTTLTWYGLEADWILGRSWMLWGSLERSQGTPDAADQAHMSVSYRF